MGYQTMPIDRGKTYTISEVTILVNINLGEVKVISLKRFLVD